LKQFLKLINIRINIFLGHQTNLRSVAGHLEAGRCPHQQVLAFQ
jgi:hypothetical protein